MTNDNPTVVAISGLRFAWPGGSLSLAVGSLSIARGERVFIHGPSGSGKSTLLGLIAGIHRPDAGSLCLLGQDLAELGSGERDRLRGATLGYVFQQFNLVPYLSVLENVLLPLTFSPERRARAETQAGSMAGVREAGCELLQRLGLEAELGTRRPTALSVGQQQRVAVARALLGTPPLIICDEPTSALDADARDAFLDVLAAQCSASGAALLFVSHDRALAAHFERQLDMRQFQVAP
jgi:putative ABC transport system ATP-binding protein